MVQTAERPAVVAVEAPPVPMTWQRPGGPAYWSTMVVLAVVAGAGVAALGSLVAGGAEPRAKWGYAAATLAFLLSTAMAAPPLALASRLGRGLWGVPLRRAAELWAVAGLVVAPLGVLLLAHLPEWRGRPSIWLDWPGAPLVWDGAALVLLGLAGLALLYLGSLPDLAALRDGRAGRLTRPLALGWSGTGRRWDVVARGIVLLGALYLVLYVFMHLLVSSDLALSLVPGWASANVPPYHAVSGLQAGLATAVLALAALRRWGGGGALTPAHSQGEREREARRDREAFGAAGKLLLAFGLLFFYFTWSELLTYWYGRKPEERELLRLLMFGPYFGPFVLSMLLNCLLPVGLLIWNPIRRSAAGVTLVAALVVVGSFVDRVRIYVAAWSVAGPVGAHLGPLPPTQYPGIADVLLLAGMPAAVVLLYLLALRVVPAYALWEWRAARLLRAERPYGRTRVEVVGRPS
jgi:molybdopterin-containing oxidoreductase family membrane subunit